MGNPTTPPLYEQWHAGGFIVSEANGHMSRDTITVLSGAGVVRAGTVLGKVTSSGGYVPLNEAATDGSNVAAGILFGGVDATVSNKPALLFARLGEFNPAEIIWPPGATGAQVTTALGQLAALYLLPAPH